MATPEVQDQQRVRRRAPERIIVPPDAGMHGTPALLAILGIMAVVLLSALDQTIVGTALPRVVADLGGFDLYAWVATSYLLTSTVMVPVMGKFGDLYGRKPFLLASVVIFVGASAVAGAAQSMIWLIVARGVQGIGAGMLQATAFTSVSDMFPQPERRARWQGLITSTFGIASVIGPSLGGIMTDSLGWRSVFYVNLPIGVLAVALIWLTLPSDLSPRTPNARIDWAGAATITLAISALLLAVEWGGDTMPWASPQIIGLLALSVTMIVSFGLIERRAPEPLLPLDLFEMPAILISSIISLLVGFALFALVYYTPLLFQGGFGISPSAAGALQTPLAVSMAMGSLTSGQLFARIRRMRPLLFTGATLLGFGSLLLLGSNTSSNLVLLSAELALTGFGVGLQLPMLTILVQSIVPRHRLGVGTSTIQFTRLIGSTIGTAIVGAAVNGLYAAGVAAAAAPGTDPRLAAAFSDPQALVDPQALAQIQDLVGQVGASQADLQQLLDAARNTLISSVHVGYMLSLGCAAAIFGLLLIMRVPDFRAAQPAPPAEDVVDLL
ncbi:MFS transporter [Oscillochloris sp. ZM17-4]|uniref:MDR family MFS transporter n=1 Tax=Oscillochloris sp. ZM17-4 TaxID=2866714 RepID=UPI001C72A3E2|nr:MDR family MFS transporter [Oscillochloris sp. ZM17-4]MBX0329173.1 MFS transporter [Oscillochloris sp. ZM17-4]